MAKGLLEIVETANIRTFEHRSIKHNASLEGNPYRGAPESTDAARTRARSGCDGHADRHQVAFIHRDGMRCIRARKVGRGNGAGDRIRRAIHVNADCRHRGTQSVAVGCEMEMTQHGMAWHGYAIDIQIDGTAHVGMEKYCPSNVARA